MASLMHDLVVDESSMARSGDIDIQLDNPMGFFESERLVDTNKEILERLGGSWELPPLLPTRWEQKPLLHWLHQFRSRFSSYALSTAWVDKDPRLCLTYPAYLHILLKRIPLVAAFREPLQVAMSLYTRDGLSINQGLALWMIYNFHLAAELSSDDLFLPYDLLLQAPEVCSGSLIQKNVYQFLERCYHPRPADQDWQRLIDSSIKPELNRSNPVLMSESRLRVNTSLLNCCQQRYDRTLAATDWLNEFINQFSTLPRPVLDEVVYEQIVLETKSVEYKSLCDQLESDLLAADELLVARSDQLQSLQEDYSLLKHKCLGIQSSTSWRMMAPFRSLMDRFRFLR